MRYMRIRSHADSGPVLRSHQLLLSDDSRREIRAVYVPTSKPEDGWVLLRDTRLLVDTSAVHGAARAHPVGGCDG
jgi:hypothetical protein